MHFIQLRTQAALMLAVSALAMSALAGTLHDQAVESARAGRYDGAVIVLQRLVREQPKNTIYRYDLIAVLSWAERHTEALEASRTVAMDATVPDYVLAAIGKSALSAQQTDRAVQAYRLLSQRQPRNTDAARSLSLALQAQLPRQRVDVAPNTSGAAVSVDANPKSADMAQAQARNAQHIREAAALLDTDFSAARYRPIDAALAENLELTAQATAAKVVDVARQLRRDRVVALTYRGLFQQAVGAFDLLNAEERVMPAYVVAAAAQASLSLRQPERAIALYTQALQSDPDRTEWLSGLMYAELEAENFPAAERIVEGQLAQRDGHFAARQTQASLLRFADRLQESQASMQALFTEQPNNAGVWLEQGDLFLRRGLPRAAAERYQAVLALEPTSIKARVGLADALWAQGAVAKAASLIGELEVQAPEHPAVQRLFRAWQRKFRPMFTSAVTKGYGQGQVAGNDDLVWESTVYSGQSDTGLRGFVNHQLAEAQFNGESARHERLGVGVEWSQPDVQATAEFGRDLRNAQEAVWAAGLGWQLSDQWSMRTRHESQTNDFPLKGRTRNAESYLGAPVYLHANKTLLGVAYRRDESRRVAADFANYEFNDGNHRQSLSASWFERLYSAYGRTLDLQTAGYASANTLRDAIYFNPQHDVAWSTTLTGDWLTYRRYARSFNQRLALTLGTYKQSSVINQGGNPVNQSYGWNAFEEIRYEHEWQLGPDFSALYGIGSRRFPYDGVYETKGFVYASVNWRP